MNKKKSRINNCIDILQNKTFISIKELASILNVSEMTARRYAKTIEGTHKARIVNGVLVYTPDMDISRAEEEYHIDNVMHIQDTHKMSIGTYASSLIEEGDFIILDTGSTTSHVLPNINSNISFKVLCLSSNVLTQALTNPNLYICIAGGHYHPNTQFFESPESVKFIQGIRANKVFISAAGIHKDLGITCVNSYEVPSKKAIIQSGAKRILLADSTKFGEIRGAYFSEMTDIHMVITDRNITDEWKDYIKSLNIELIIV